MKATKCHFIVLFYYFLFIYSLFYLFIYLFIYYYFFIKYSVLVTFENFNTADFKTVIKQSACFTVDLIKFDHFAYLFNCTAVGRGSDSVMVRTLKLVI